MSKIYAILFLTFICVNICGAANDSRKTFIKKYKSIAIQEMDRTGIPASIKLAQGILESGCGKSKLAINANNHFGIKCHNWNGASFTMDDDSRETNASANTGTRKNHGSTTANFWYPVPGTRPCSNFPRRTTRVGQKD